MKRIRIIELLLFGLLIFFGFNALTWWNNGSVLQEQTMGKYWKIQQ